MQLEGKTLFIFATFLLKRPRGAFFLGAASPLLKNKIAFRAIKKPGIAPGGDSHEKTILLT